MNEQEKSYGDFPHLKGFPQFDNFCQILDTRNKFSPGTAGFQCSMQPPDERCIQICENYLAICIKYITWVNCSFFLIDNLEEESQIGFQFFLNGFLACTYCTYLGILFDLNCLKQKRQPKIRNSKDLQIYFTTWTNFKC